MSDISVQRCMVHKERNLLAHAPKALHEEIKRRIKTPCALPSAETATMLFWALMASGQISMRRVDGWQTLEHVPSQQPIDLTA